MKRFNTLNRALIKRMELLPNVFEFSTEKYGIHEYAAIYGIEKILRRCKSTKLLKSQPNFYLERQHKRLSVYAQNGQVAEFNYLSQVIIRKSISFRILALNRTIKDWFIQPIRNLRRIWRSLSFISSTLSSDLKFKRVWIDKKEGDYARPLGVPTPAWRSYSFMWMDHIEKFYKGNGNLQSWQHGGRSGVGVLSCYQQLIPRLKSSNTIYEFDIKGFFDNISHESIIKRFQETMGKTVSGWVADILKAKPSRYVLPPIDADIATQRYTREIDSSGAHSVNIDYISFYQDGIRSLPEMYKELMQTKVPKLNDHGMPTGESLLTEEFLSLKREIYMKNKDHLIYFFDDGRTIEQIFADDMKNQFQTLLDENFKEIGRPYTEADREIGRDSWKDLGQPGKGVPQGLGTSPFISTFLTDTYLYELGTDKKALIMYMDDGILFANSKEEMENNIKRLKELLSIIGLELSPEKSKYVKIDNRWEESIKFLGLRYLPESDTFISDTRSGTKIEFPSKGDWADVQTLAAINQTNLSGIREKYDKLINTQAYEAGLKYGFLGCLIAGSQYKDSPDMETKREEIRTGQNSAWAKIEGSKGFIWKSQDLVNHTEYLTNVSSIACHRFAEFNRLGRSFFIRKNNRGRKLRVQRVPA
jgi:hypothetical protein